MKDLQAQMARRSDSVGMEAAVRNFEGLLNWKDMLTLLGMGREGMGVRLWDVRRMGSKSSRGRTS